MPKIGCSPRALAPHVKELQQILLRNDRFIPGSQNEDADDLARRATFTASSYKIGGEPMKVIDGISRRLGNDTHGWVSDGISDEGEVLAMRFDTPTAISELRYTFDSDFRYPIRVTMAPNRQKQQRPGVPEELVRDYDVIMKRGGAEVRRIEVRDNHQRHNILRFDKTVCDTVELCVRSTHGEPEITVFEVRAYENQQ